jgi:hypothetical protein
VPRAEHRGGMKGRHSGIVVLSAWQGKV